VLVAGDDMKLALVGYFCVVAVADVVVAYTSAAAVVAVERVADDRILLPTTEHVLVVVVAVAWTADGRNLKTAPSEKKKINFYRFKTLFFIKV